VSRSGRRHGFVSVESPVGWNVEAEGVSASDMAVSLSAEAKRTIEWEKAASWSVETAIFPEGSWASARNQSYSRGIAVAAVEDRKQGCSDRLFRPC
jgi:hypothetical protein